jgi:hypothetical protein
MTTIINTPSGTTDSGSSGGFAVAIIILLIVLAGGAFVWFQYRGNGSVRPTNINVTLPATPAPVVPAIIPTPVKQ